MSPPIPPSHSPDCEYLVVGSGAGGGTLAARLAEAGQRVILLEAGGDPRELIGGDPVQPARQPAASRLRRAGLPRVRLREQRNRLELLRPPLRRRRGAAARPEVRGDARGFARRRRLLPAGGRARRVHRAQRDDFRLSAQRGLGLHRGADWRHELVLGEYADATSSGSRTAGTGRSTAGCRSSASTPRGTAGTAGCRRKP